MPTSPDRKLRVSFLAPTQWERNESRSSCASCKRLFSLFVRRHHCRLCGQIFCNACSMRRVYAKRVCGDCYVTTTQMMKVKRQRAKEKWLQKQAYKQANGEGRQMQKSGSSDSIKMDLSPESPKSLSSSRGTGSTNSLLPPSDPWYSVFRICCRADDVAPQLPSPSTATTPPPSPPQTHTKLAPPPSVAPRLPGEFGGYTLTKRASVPKSMSCTSLASICERSDENEEDEDEEDNEEEEEEPVVLEVDDDEEEDEEPIEDEPPSPSEESFDKTGQECGIVQCRSADMQVFAMG